MPRQSRGSSAPPRRPAPAPARPAAPQQPQARQASTAAHPPATQQHAPPPAQQQSGGGSGLFGQMASTAAYVKPTTIPYFKKLTFSQWCRSRLFHRPRHRWLLRRWLFRPSSRTTAGSGSNEPSRRQHIHIIPVPSTTSVRDGRHQLPSMYGPEPR